MSDGFARDQHLELVQGDDYLRSDGRGISFSGAGVCWPSNLCAARLLVTDSHACGSANGAAVPVVMEFPGYFIGAWAPGVPSVCFDLPRHSTAKLAAGVRRYGFEVRAKSQVGHTVTLVRGSVTVLASGAISACTDRSECHPCEAATPGCRSCPPSGPCPTEGNHMNCKSCPAPHQSHAFARVASFGRDGEDLVLRLTDGTEWKVPFSAGQDQNVTGAEVEGNTDGTLTVTLQLDEGGEPVSFTLPGGSSLTIQPATPPANAIADDGSVPTRFYGSNARALGEPDGWLVLPVAGVGAVKVPYYMDRPPVNGSGGGS